MKLPILTRVVEVRRQPFFHVAAMLGFSLDAPRALADELAFWSTVSSALGATGVIDEGLAKARGEVLAAGSFFAPGGSATPASYVRVRVGSVDKRLAVVGDRVWRDKVPTEPEPMIVMPVDWAHAFGGANFDRNLYGKGAESLDRDGETVQPLPNIERYGALIRTPGAKPEPASFLPMDMTFAQRRERAGTYDKRWFEEHFPGLPPDAEPTFFNVAAQDQWIEGMFRGDEEFLVENMHPTRPRLEGKLPGLKARCFVTIRDGKVEQFIEMPLRCDTVWLFPDLLFGVVVFHGSLPVASDDGAEIVHLVGACEDPTSPLHIDHYQKALTRRLDKDKGALANLSDADLMPLRTSGVAPNIGELDIARWVKSENLMRQNLRRGQERRFSEGRARMIAEGRDPALYGFAEPPDELDPPPEDLDEIEGYVEQVQAKVALATVEATKKAAEMERRAREAYAEMGMDYDDVIKRATGKGAGPPKFSAQAHLAELRSLVSSRNDDPMVERLKRELDLPALELRLEQQEHSLLETYRRYGHFQPTAAAMDSEGSDRIRILIQLSIETGESLVGRDLTGANLSGMDLAGVDLSGAFLEGADLSEADLSGAKLENAVLAKANLRGARLAGAKLGGANLGGSILRDATFDDADLSDAVLDRADIRGSYFSGAKLTGISWLEATLAEVDFSRASIGNCTLIKADLRGANFAGADLSGATLIECDLDGADFSGATLDKTTFITCKGDGALFRRASMSQVVVLHGSSFPRADFADAEMPRANLRGTILTGARFDRANLAGADLSECDASNASFERTVIMSAMLTRTNLTAATLRGANLADALASKALIAGTNFTGANLFRADLSRVVADSKTTFAEAEVGHVRFLPKANAPREGTS